MRRFGPRPPLELLIPCGFVLAVVTCVAVTLVLPEGAARVIATAVAVGVFAAWARRPAAASATAVMAWSFTTGFLVNAQGELSFARDDMVRLGAFIAAGLLGSAYGALVDLRDSRRRVRRLMRARGDAHRPPVLLGRMHPRTVTTGRGDSAK